jgi:hypothetical protein
MTFCNQLTYIAEFSFNRKALDKSRFDSLDSLNDKMDTSQPSLKKCGGICVHDHKGKDICSKQLKLKKSVLAA